MTKKQYTLIMNYTYYIIFESKCEKTKTKEFESDDLNELVNILSQYINGFISKEKKSKCWMDFFAEIRNNRLVSYALEYKVYNISMTRRD